MGLSLLVSQGLDNGSPKVHHSVMEGQRVRFAGQVKKWVGDKVVWSLWRSVLVRDLWLCRYCGCTLSWRTEGGAPQIDHVVAYANRGVTHSSNLVACCRDCNMAKAISANWKPKSLGELVEALPLGAARGWRERQLRRRERRDMHLCRRCGTEAITVVDGRGDAWCEGCGKKAYLAAGWRRQVKLHSVEEVQQHGI